MIEMLRTSKASLSSHGASLAGAAEREPDHAPPRKRRERLARAGHDACPSERTRSGWLPASTCAIIPPIEAPTTCARSMLQVVEQTLASSAMSTSVYGTGLRLPTDSAPPARYTEPSARRPCNLRRQADVAVVEPDHPVAPLDQLRAEAVGPHRQLRADAHDQQDRRGLRDRRDPRRRARRPPQTARPAAGLHTPVYRLRGLTGRASRA